MSKFQSTVSTVAALASIFGAAAAGWKLASDSKVEQPPAEIQQKIEDLEQKITADKPEVKTPLPVQLPPVATTPAPVTLPPVPQSSTPAPPPPVTPGSEVSSQVSP